MHIARKSSLLRQLLHKQQPQQQHLFSSRSTTAFAAKCGYKSATILHGSLHRRQVSGSSDAVVRTLNYGRSEELGAGAGGGPILASMLGESPRVAKILVTDQSNDSFLKENNCGFPSSLINRRMNTGHKNPIKD
jgi:hypothetical protein